MSGHRKQIFQADSPVRWKSIKFILLISSLLLIVLISTGIYSLINKEDLLIPRLLSEKALSRIATKDLQDNTAHSEFNKDIEKIRKQHRPDFYHHAILPFDKNARLKPMLPVRAGFYVNWDIQSFQSLQKHVDKMNMVLPEWFFVQDNSDEIFVDLPPTALKAMEIMKKEHVSIVPMVSNYFNERWNGHNVQRIIHDKDRKRIFIRSIIDNLEKYHFQGINIDFEDLEENSDEYLTQFIEELAIALHSKGFILTQDVAPFNEDYNYEALSKCNDLIFLMAYDQHNMNSVAGPVCTYKWLENALDEATHKIPPEKLVLCVAAYGYDWPTGFVGTDITYEEAIAIASESDTVPAFDPDNYNLSYTYSDDGKITHKVFFTDAATCYNIIRAGYNFGTSGTAIWRLGSEDERIWTFYNKNLDFDNIRKEGFDKNTMQLIQASGFVDYLGEGEILDLMKNPSEGKVEIKFDTSQNLISEQTYQILPTGYVIKKAGEKSKKIVLSFDDGPDELYTNKIIDILNHYKIPATFFVLGINIQSNLPTFKRLFSNGYEIGNHTYTHTNLEVASEERTLIELRSTRRMIEAVTGRSTILFRPPYRIDAEPTNMNELKSIAIGRDENYLYVGSSIDTRDWEKDVKADTIIARAIAQRDLGNIILMHDAGGPREETVKALPAIIEYYLQHGYKFTTIGDLINRPESELMPAAKGEKRDLINTANDTAVTLTYYIGLLLYGIFFAALLLTSFRLIVIAALAIRKHWSLKLSAKEKRSFALEHRVSIIVPAYNEEVNIVRTVEHLLSLQYPNLELMIIDDGSKDGTLHLLQTHFGRNEKVKIHTKPNGGKADSINYGISKAEGNLLFCIDADTFIVPGAIEKMVYYFQDENVGAVAGNVKVGNKVNWLTNWQSIEYTTSQNFDRLAFDTLNAIMVVPGAIGMFDKRKVLEVGGFETDTLAEDCDITLRLLAAGYTVKTCNNAEAYTEAPEDIPNFMKQRKRWSFGIMQSFWKHRTLLFSFRQPNIGWVVLPNILFFQMILPLFNPVVDLVLICSLIFGKTSIVFGLYLIYLFIEMMIATLAYACEGKRISLKILLYMIPQRIIYRQLFFVVLAKSYLKIFKGELQNWGILKRTGHINSEAV